MFALWRQNSIVPTAGTQFDTKHQTLTNHVLDKCVWVTSFSSQSIALRFVAFFTTIQNSNFNKF